MVFFFIIFYFKPQNCSISLRANFSISFFFLFFFFFLNNVFTKKKKKIHKTVLYQENAFKNRKYYTTKICTLPFQKSLHKNVEKCQPFFSFPEHLTFNLGHNYLLTYNVCFCIKYGRYKPTIRTVKLQTTTHYSPHPTFPP